MRGLLIWVALSAILLTACNKGLTPPEIQPSVIDFPIPPEGGNPAGFWVPDTTRPVEVILLDEFPVDSIIFDTEFNGVFSFELTGVCSLNAILTVSPNIYVLGQRVALDISISDTISGQGPYHIIEDKALTIPVETTVFNVDTLGFSSYENSLDLITLPTMYTYENTLDLRFYCLIHLTRSVAKASRPTDFVFALRQKEEGWP